MNNINVAVTISVTTDFSPYPVGRYISDGPVSAQRFREDFLKPPLYKSQKLHVTLDCPFGIASSFLEEAFGGLIREDKFEVLFLKKYVTLAGSEATVAKIWKYVEEAGSVAQEPSDERVEPFDRALMVQHGGGALLDAYSLVPPNELTTPSIHQFHEATVSPAFMNFLNTYTHNTVHFNNCEFKKDCSIGTEHNTLERFTFSGVARFGDRCKFFMPINFPMGTCFGALNKIHGGSYIGGHSFIGFKTFVGDGCTVGPQVLLHENVIFGKDIILEEFNPDTWGTLASIEDIKLKKWERNYCSFIHHKYHLYLFMLQAGLGVSFRHNNPALNFVGTLSDFAHYLTFTTDNSTGFDSMVLAIRDKLKVGRDKWYIPTSPYIYELDAHCEELLAKGIKTP